MMIENCDRVMLFLNALAKAAKGELPVDSPDWALTTRQTSPILHGSLRSVLSESFDNWWLFHFDGCTVAHVIASVQVLPEGFDGWDWARNDGLTVAHVASVTGHLPDDFDQWDLTYKGHTVLEMSLKHFMKSLEDLRKWEPT
jgi:hypothetical protein